MNSVERVRLAVDTIIELLQPLEWEERARILATAAIFNGLYASAQEILKLLQQRKQANE